MKRSIPLRSSRYRLIRLPLPLSRLLPRTFIGGHTYTATVYLWPEEVYTFNNSVSGTINGETATVTGNTSGVEVKYSFPALSINKITKVAVTDVTAPAVGEMASYLALTGIDHEFAATAAGVPTITYRSAAQD